MNQQPHYPELMAPHYPGLLPVEGIVDKYARLLTEGLPPNAQIGLVHATAYTDDRQAMVFLADKLKTLGFQSSLISPEQVQWKSGQAFIKTEWCDGRADLLVRYYPGEWLPNLPRQSSWHHFLTESQTPISNPATALLTQSKRHPLVWDKLRTPMPTWRKLLPPCAEIQDVPWKSDSDWLAKPALGRVGYGIGLRECLTDKEWSDICKQVRRYPHHWVAQRRFRIVPLSVPSGKGYPCLGIYTIDGKVAGAYGRMAARPLIDNQAQDIAIFINPSP